MFDGNSDVCHKSNRHPTTKPNHIAIYYHFISVYVVPESIHPFFWVPANANGSLLAEVVLSLSPVANYALHLWGLACFFVELCVEYDKSRAMDRLNA